MCLQVILHSMHKYLPRLHIIQSPDPCSPFSGGYLRFTFPEAAFIAVTAYQNAEVKKHAWFWKVLCDRINRILTHVLRTWSVHVDNNELWQEVDVLRNYRMFRWASMKSLVWVALLRQNMDTAWTAIFLCTLFNESLFISPQVTKLKIDNNPFAKGFRDSGLNRKR